MNLAPKSLIAALLVLGLTSLSRGQAAPAAASPPPTKLAVINLVTLFDGLLEKTDADTDIDTMKSGYEKDAQKLQEELQKMNNDITHPVFKIDSPEYKQLQLDLLKKATDYQSFDRWYKQVLVMEQTLRTAGLYKKINDAVAAYSQESGIALVFIVDELNVSKAQSPEQLTAMVTVRKIMYAHPSFDITNAIKQKMNTAYQIGGRTAAPATRK